MSGLGGVLNYAGCFAKAAGSVDRVNEWEAGLRDGLGFIHNPLQFLMVLERAGAIPSCDTTGKDAFYGTPVKVGESRSKHAKFPQPPEKIEALVGFLRYSVSVEGPDRLMVIWTPKNLKILTISTSSPLGHALHHAS